MKPLEAWIYFVKFERGCEICRRIGWGKTLAEYHHILENGHRAGDFIGYGLCPSHHQSRSKDIVGRDHSQRRFEEHYGVKEYELLQETQNAYVLYNKRMV